MLVILNELSKKNLFYLAPVGGTRSQEHTPVYTFGFEISLFGVKNRKLKRNIMFSLLFGHAVFTPLRGEIRAKCAEIPK